MSDLKVITGDFVNLQISTSKDDISFNEKRFPKDLTISDLKVKLELITGGNCNTMKLEAYTEENKFVCHLDNDKALLGSYPLENGMRLHVIDQFQIRNELDFADVPKYELSQEEYDSKSDSVRAFLQKNKLGLNTQGYHGAIGGWHMDSSEGTHVHAKCSHSGPSLEIHQVVPPRATVRDRLPPMNTHNILSQEKNCLETGIESAQRMATD
ncbi:unnamed protein product [Acanthoscelides obtectus]|uniref:Ubiquitin-like domain-containing protein n=1 Tax=Acanthoscelides obtectus TaxID=200917 RepID=A0A9P0LHG4_ACAOB|nr:unnamed protein product [Acanthoscelides obtectus]CAK1634993.1 Tubulin-folding cofactor B [Acanthoscelides obtectus]